MILVDIGNSGLRATRLAKGETFSNQRVYRLSWSATVAPHVRKPSPEQESEPNQKWCSIQDLDAYAWLVKQLSKQPTNEEWLISCVQRTALEHLRGVLQSEGCNHLVRVVSYRDVPMPMRVDEPSKTGIDRLVASYAASQAFQKNATQIQSIIVVQAGTAVTVDLVDSQGVFCGGAIMPGLGLSLQLLAAGTDQLPWLGNHLVDTQPVLPGVNTTEAISAGVNAALVGGVGHLVRRYRSDHQHANFGNQAGPLQVVVTGGDGKLLLPHIDQPCQFVDHLVLAGLSLMQEV
jgi:type III pantothenate kinase